MTCQACETSDVFPLWWELPWLVYLAQGFQLKFIVQTETWNNPEFPVILLERHFCGLNPINRS